MLRVHQGFKRLATPRLRQVGESLGASAAVQVSLFVSGIVMARSLGPSGRGDLAILLVLPVVAVQLGGVGIPSAVTYHIARNKPAARVIVRRVAPVAALQVLLTAVLLLALTQLFLGSKASATQLAGLLTVAIVPLLVVQYHGIHILQGLGDIRWFNGFRVATPALFSIGLTLSLLTGLTVLSCVLIWIATGVAATVCMVVVLAVRIRHFEERHALVKPVPPRREIVRFGLVGFLAQVSPVETFRVDTLVVAALFPSQIVGYYAVALSISNAPRFIADALVAVAYPQIAGQEPNEARTSARRYMRAAIMACGGATLAMAWAAPFIIPLLFGGPYEPAVLLSVILLSAAGLISVKRVGTDCLRALGRPAVTSRIEVGALSVLAVGFVVLAPWDSGKGVALALIGSGAAGLFLTLRSLRDERA